MGEIPNFFRKPHGPGWALVGNAGFSGRQPLEEALAGYEQRRNEQAMPLYELAIQSVSFQPPAPEQVMLLRALKGNQEATNRFLGITGDARELAEFMAPESIGRIIIQAQERAAPA